MSTGYSWEGIRQVRATLLGARHVPEPLWWLCLLGALYQVFDLYFFKWGQKKKMRRQTEMEKESAQRDRLTQMYTYIYDFELRWHVSDVTVAANSTASRRRPGKHAQAGHAVDPIKPTNQQRCADPFTDYDPPAIWSLAERPLVTLTYSVQATTLCVMRLQINK